jgi:hypothetical protein
MKHIRIYIINVFFYLFFLVIFYTPLSAQDYFRSINVKFSTEQIKLDGVLDEAAWKTAESSPEFWQYFPSDSVMAEHQTSFRLLYNDHTLYAGIRGEKAEGDYVISSLRRDFRGTVSDNVVLMFDPFSDGTNAFVFGVTPYGVQRDVFVPDGGSNYNTWDVKWQVETSTFDDHFIMEMDFCSMTSKQTTSEKVLNTTAMQRLLSVMQ